MGFVFSPEFLVVLVAVAAVVWAVNRVNTVVRDSERMARLDEDVIRSLLDESFLSYMVIGMAKPSDIIPGCYFFRLMNEVETSDGRFCGVASSDRGNNAFLVSPEMELVYSGDVEVETLLKVRGAMVKTISESTRNGYGDEEDTSVKGESAADS